MNAAAKAQWLSTIQWTFVMVAFILLVAVTGGCNMVKFSNISGADPGDFTLRFGIWRYQSWSFVISGSGESFVTESCHSYPSYVEVDGNWKASRAFAVLAFIFAIFVIILDIAPACTNNPNKYSYIRKFEAPLLLLTALFQGLVLLILNSNVCKDNVQVADLGNPDSALKDIEFQDTCSIDRGAKCIISATVFWFAAAIVGIISGKVESDMLNADIDSGLDEPLNP
eukprot:CAMPEP_0183740780 /NCGR_PEP_ID=MMETSP0737-20130205/60500_1 /TAXON_ID=385413 /ORGANISM="Thalassiosira miniscula, Strain CCMP1093" /LENGTH=225 /DNA_ID=CAMNT_0025975925 /DNA_START=23 /DNA_END=700 /DNA_ORIENTATION=-